MSIWTSLRRKLSSIADSILRSETHLESIARAGEDRRRVPQRLEGIEHHISVVAAIMARREMVEIMADPRLQDPLRLERSGFKVRSQHDEDGIIGEIFRRIGPTSRTFVEFGSGRGDENCTAFLLMQGWRGLWIDGSAASVVEAERTWTKEIGRGLLTVRNAKVSVDSIDGIIGAAGFGGEIDFLAVDIDGNDYHVLERIASVTPRVICVEYNATIPPEVPWVMPRDDDHIWQGGDQQVGASLKALELMLADRGYVLAGCSIAGVNAFFIRADLAQGKFAEPFTAENHYQPWRLFYLGIVQATNWRGWRV